MITLNEVKKVIPSAINVEPYSLGFNGGIKVTYTGRAPFKKNIQIGEIYYRWHYDEQSLVVGNKIRLYMKV